MIAPDELYRRSVLIPLREPLNNLHYVGAMSIATMAEGSDPTWRKSDVPALAWGRRVSKIVANMQARIGSYLGGVRFWTPVFGTHAKKKP